MDARERLHLVVRRSSALEALPVPVLRVARLCDGVRTLEGVIAASELSEACTRDVVEHLCRIGLVTTRPSVVRERVLRLLRRRRAEGSTP